MQTRRDFIKYTVGGAIGTMIGSYCHGTQPQKPHIVLVTMDTTGMRHMGCYGYQHHTTPNLDAFAARSIHFATPYSSGNETLPSHASIFTGRYPHNHGTILQQPINPEIETLGKALQRKGYRTAAITSTPFLNANTVGNGFQNFLPAKGFPSAADTVNKAISFLNEAEDKSQPLYLWIHLWDPHSPYSPVDAYLPRFLDPADRQRLKELRLIKQELNPNTKSHSVRLQATEDNLEFLKRDQRIVISQHDAEIAYMDFHLGRLLHYLHTNKAFRNTISIFTADHGEALFERDQCLVAHSMIHQPVVQIPMIIHHPDYEPKRVDGLVQNIDLAPTILAWADAEPAEVDGIAMQPLIESGTQIRDHICLTETGNRFLAIVDARYKVKKLVKPIKKPQQHPEQWKKDLNLPRIEFNAEIPSPWTFDETDQRLRYSWTAPPQCREQIDSYAIEFMSGQGHPWDVMSHKENIRITAEGGAMVGNRLPAVLWQFEASHTPRYFRVVAKNNANRIIATSKILIESLALVDGGSEIFDLLKDPNETQNLAGQSVPVQNLLAQLETFAQKSAQAISEHEAAPTLSEEDKQTLSALNYL